MKKYLYKQKNTGQKIYSDNKLDREDLELVRELKNTKMPGSKVNTKSRTETKNKEE